MTTSPGHVASSVRAELARRGRSHREAADHLGLSKAAMSNRTRGSKEFTVREVLALAEWLNIPVSVLMDEPGAREHTDVAPHPRAPLAQPIPA